MAVTVEDPTLVAHYRQQMLRYADALDHALALDGNLHDQGVCRTCDWIRVRPAVAFGAETAEEAEALRDAYMAELRRPRA